MTYSYRFVKHRFEYWVIKKKHMLSLKAVLKVCFDISCYGFTCKIYIFLIRLFRILIEHPVFSNKYVESKVNWFVFNYNSDGVGTSTVTSGLAPRTVQTSWPSRLTANSFRTGPRGKVSDWGSTQLNVMVIHCFFMIVSSLQICC